MASAMGLDPLIGAYMGLMGGGIGGSLWAGSRAFTLARAARRWQAPEVSDDEVIHAIRTVPIHRARRIPYSDGRKGDVFQWELFEDTQYVPNPQLMVSGGLRRAALEGHALLPSDIGRRRSTVSLAEVELPDGRRQIWGAGSGGDLTPAQRTYLEQLGVRLFTGVNHGELNIIGNLPQGAQIHRWGIAWGEGRNGTPWNFPCGDCAPDVLRVPGAGLFE